MSQQTECPLYPIVEWVPVDGVWYNGLPVYRHPGNNDLACDAGEYLLNLPANIARAIHDNVKGKLR